MNNSALKVEQPAKPKDITLLDPSVIDEDQLMIQVEQIMDQADKSVSSKDDALNKITVLLQEIPDPGKRDLYVDAIAKRYDVTKNVLRQKMKKFGNKKSKAKTGIDDGFLNDKIPPEADSELFMQYGFYELDNKLFFVTRNGIKQGANFILRPLFHVRGPMDAKRLFRISNEFGVSETIELLQKDLTSLQAFKLRVESLGNFLWVVGDAELNKLKGYLYANTESCTEVKQLGYQRNGFWAWSNGIYTGKFQEIDEYGIIRFEGKSYYIPALSKFYKDEPTLFVSEKRFSHCPGNVTLQQLLILIKKVFGSNGMVGFAYLLATCFRDIIVSRHNFFPLMNIFGPKSTGKTELANCLLHFFGQAHPGPNINNTSKAALADHVAKFRNAVCHIDEYKNNLEFEKIEFLKGLWDGTGRSRMNMDKDKKMETTSVDSGVVITGQEMPTSDIALFSRVIFLTFHQTEFNDEEKQLFNQLKELAKKGFTHITHEILFHRQHFLENYVRHYVKASKELSEKLSGQQIIDRIFQNWTIVLAAFRTLIERLSMPYKYEEMVDIVYNLMQRQNSETDQSDDVASFWNIFNYLVKEGELEEEVDFRVRSTTCLKVAGRNYDWEEIREVLYVNHTRVFDKYLKHGAQIRDHVLPRKTLEHYLKNSREYFGLVKSCRFKMNKSKWGDFDTMNKSQEQITTAHAFSYSDLKAKYGLSVILSSDNDDEPDGPVG